MNSRERFRACARFEPVDRAFRWEMHPFPETLKRWHAEGMPEDAHLSQIVGYDFFEQVRINLNLAPAFTEETLETTDEYRIYRAADGVIKKLRLDTPPPAMPQYVRYPLETRDDWKQLLKRLDPASPSRLPEWWELMKPVYEHVAHPVGVPAGSLFGWLRNWAGIEGIATMLYDDPALVVEMMDHLTELILHVLRQVVFDVQFDFACMWEDMAYKTASLISPRHVEELMVPRYMRITDLLHEAGIDVIMLDSDGNVDELIPLWLACGINFIYPMEVAAGMDVLALREKHGRELIIGGGMDKRVLSGGKAGIRVMVEEKRELIAGGGYFPGVDHAIPPDISWENFLYYRQLLADIGG